MRYSKIIDAVTQGYFYGDKYTRDNVIPAMAPDEQERCYAIGKRYLEDGMVAFFEDIAFLYQERDMDLKYKEALRKGA